MVQVNNNNTTIYKLFIYLVSFESLKFQTVLSVTKLSSLWQSCSLLGYCQCCFCSLQSTRLANLCSFCFMGQKTYKMLSCVCIMCICFAYAMIEDFFCYGKLLMAL